MAFNLSDLTSGLERFLQAWQIVRICPNEINAPKEQLSFNILTLGIAVAIFMLARHTISGVDNDIPTDIFATVISSFIIFVSGYVSLIFYPQGGLEGAYKWGTFFVLTWITSLICAIVIDGISIWNTRHALSSVVIDEFFVPGTLPSLVKNLLRALGFGIISLIILSIKTRIMDPSFKINSWCAIATFVFALAMNSVLLLLFLYSNVL